jgi:class 3 adenylate cyclase
LSTVENRQRALSPEYENVLVASGLIHGVSDPAALKPVLRELFEGEALCEAGDEADCIWVIARGTLAARQDQDTIVARTAPAIFGEQGVIDTIGRRRARVVALNGFAEVLEIRKSAIDAHPDADRIWRNCAWIVCRKLDESTAESQRYREEIRRLYRLLRLYVGEHALSEGKLAPQLAVDGPRNEKAVIWFSDIVGFSKYSTLMSPYQAASFAQQFLTPQVEAIDRRRGYIDKFIGDAVMAYWVVSSSSGTEECEAALSAARSVLDAIGALSLGPDPLRIRIGLHIGRVAVGNFGTPLRSQFTLIGPEVNKASRLESSGEPQVESGGPLGSIRMSDEFYGLLSDASQALLDVEAVVIAKNIGSLHLFTTSK